jgi:DNA-binding transcriptional MerR regulator
LTLAQTYITLRYVMIKSLKIGGICQAAGVTPRTVRYYEEYGFISAQISNQTVHKTYASDAVPIIKGIKQLQDLGYSLQQIKKHLFLSQSAKTQNRWLTLKLCSELEKQNKLLIAKIQTLQKKERSLRQLLDDTKGCPVCQAQDCALCGKLAKLRSLHIA